MQNENIDSEIHIFYYIRHKHVLCEERKLEYILKPLMPIVKCIRFREIFCREFSDFFLNIDFGYENAHF
jgi:hypothetical protein